MSASHSVLAAVAMADCNAMFESLLRPDDILAVWHLSSMIVRMPRVDVIPKGFEDDSM